MPLIYQNASQQQLNELAYLRGNSARFVELENQILASGITTIAFIETNNNRSRMYVFDRGDQDGVFKIGFNPDRINREPGEFGYVTVPDGYIIAHELGHRFDTSKSEAEATAIENEVRAQLPGGTLRGEYSDTITVNRVKGGSFGEPLVFFPPDFLNQSTDPATREYYDPSGNLTRVVFNKLDGGKTDTTISPTTIFGDVVRTVESDVGDRVVADSVIYKGLLGQYLNSHNISELGVGEWDEATAGSFVASLERATYLGDAVSGGVEGIFVDTGPFRSFSTGSYDIDVESGLIDTNTFDFGTGLTVIEPSFAFDTSSYDAGFDDWDFQTATRAFEIGTFDSWGYGDRYEPVVLDLDGDGIDIIGRDNSNAEFDVDGDGFDERTAWVGPGDGLLVLNNVANDLPSGIVVADYDAALEEPARLAA